MSEGLFSGNKGESVFCEPLLRFPRENRLPEFFQKTAALNDERLLAIVAALIVEDRLDAALGAFLPRYGRLSDAKEYTFSLKIALLEALALIPPRILAAATIIRRIRNEFAHDLELESFSQLKGSLSNALMNLRADAFGHLGERKPLATFGQEYEQLAFYCIAGLDTYRDSLSQLRSQIQKPEFVQSLSAQVVGESLAELNSIYGEGPVSVEYKDGQKYERFARGVVRISDAGTVVPEESAKNTSNE